MTDELDYTVCTTECYLLSFLFSRKLSESDPEIIFLQFVMKDTSHYTFLLTVKFKIIHYNVLTVKFKIH